MEKNQFIKESCIICSSEHISICVEIKQVPVCCNRLFQSYTEATNAAKGDILLGYCHSCGHIFNMVFDVDKIVYDQDYENSLHFSPFFQAHAESLAFWLIEQYDLRNKNVLEIGCGNGDFLKLMCSLGGNRGIGFDPGFPNREEKLYDQVTFIRDYYNEDYHDIKVDFVICRHVLEHLANPITFLSDIRQNLSKSNQPILFFEVPNGSYTIRELGIWDIIYEHCSYFCKHSLTYAFKVSEYETLNAGKVFGDQYLWVIASPITRRGKKIRRHFFNNIRDSCPTTLEIAAFGKKYKRKVAYWQDKIHRMKDIGKRIVIWGGGSKGISFLNTIKNSHYIDYVIDINPHKQGKFIPCSGHEIIGPEMVTEIKPDVIIVMNKIYLSEIQNLLKSMNLTAHILTV